MVNGEIYIHKDIVYLLKVYVITIMYIYYGIFLLYDTIY